MNRKIRQNLQALVEGIIESYELNPVSHSQFRCAMPNKATITGITESLLEIIFPGYFGENSPDTASLPYYIGNIILDIEERLTEQITLALSSRERTLNGDGGCHNENAVNSAESICYEFIATLPKLRAILAKDVRAAFDGDPASFDMDMIIFCYPGIFATGVYRLAHELFMLDVPYIPRIMTEYAHGKTGIDIHPGASIGEYFFIDHGTGVVIGETTVIGNNVKLYQGVTLGALSTKGGRGLIGVKRHPTLEDNVTIYSGATVLGGETIIGKGVTVGGNTFITESKLKKQEDNK